MVLFTNFCQRSQQRVPCTFIFDRLFFLSRSSCSIRCWSSSALNKCIVFSGLRPSIYWCVHNNCFGICATVRKLYFECESPLAVTHCLIGFTVRVRVYIGLLSLFDFGLYQYHCVAFLFLFSVAVFIIHKQLKVFCIKLEFLLLLQGATSKNECIFRCQ